MIRLAISAEERAFLLAFNAPAVICDAQLEWKETLAMFPCFVGFKGNGTDFNLSCLASVVC
jgi:hypothetical protein